MASILNDVQNARMATMFKDGSIETYQNELDRSLFPKEFSSSCEVVVLALAYGLTKEGLIKSGSKNPQKEANLEVAKTYKFI